MTGPGAIRSHRRTERRRTALSGLTNGEFAVLIEALRDAEAFRSSIIDAELPPRSVPRKEWDPDDILNEQIWKRSVANYRALRRKLERWERAA